jgi:hypothetical protein
MRYTGMQVAGAKTSESGPCTCPDRDTPPDLTGLLVATLGPEGTDAAAAAAVLGAVVQLCPSFPDAMVFARRERCHALIAVGYLDPDRETGDSWVDLHFTYLRHLVLRRVWESPTKPMCLATRPGVNWADLRQPTVAIHPSTEALARELVPEGARFLHVRAKPLAVEAALDGRADACLGSVDVVERAELVAIETLQPTMV